MQKTRYHTYGDIALAPENLILGLKNGVALPEDWSDFTSANGNMLKGTDSDTLVGTTGARSVVSVTAGGGGGHNNGTGVSCAAGYYSYCGSSCLAPIASSSYRGDHSGHSFNLIYKPSECALRLIRATKKTKIPLSAIMFGIAPNTDQSLFSLFNDESNRPLSAGVNTALVNEIKSAGTTSSRSYSHIHWDNIARTAMGVPPSAYTSFGSGGGSHTHSGGTPSVSHNLRRAAVRAFEIIDERKIEGLIGMWVGAGVPDNWSILATLVDRYLVFSPTALGEVDGDNTITVTGSTGNSSHSHSFSSPDFIVASTLFHTNSISHNHGYNQAKSYEPERYHVKFIRYMG